nr:UDP-N-acetylmuramate dehydrogenase [uncultured Blautia sp.]
MKQRLTEELTELLGNDRVLTNEPMSRHTTFRIGGPADLFLLPNTIEEIKKIREICIREQEPYFILGNGSNLLVSDSGFRGVIIQTYRNLAQIQVEGDCIRAQAGTLLSGIAQAARAASLTGFEFAAGIPGTLGGAVVMNAGAYGGEMKDVLKEATVLDGEGQIRRIPVQELAMGYRTSVIKEAGYTVLEAVISLKKGDPEQIRETMKDLAQRRISKQPLEYPSAGSTFKRPEGYFAGKLIMDSGLRGYTHGGAQVSEKHCGFVINAGGATAKDVCELMEHVQDTVYEKYNVKLEPEVKFLGDF